MIISILLFLQTFISYSDSGTKNYNQVKEWIAINFNDANKVTQLDTKELIIVKGNFVVNYKYITNQSRRVSFMLRIEIKDSTYNATISNLVAMNPNVTAERLKEIDDKISRKTLEAIEIESKVTLSSLKK